MVPPSSKTPWEIRDELDGIAAEVAALAEMQAQVRDRQLRRVQAEARRDAQVDDPSSKVKLLLVRFLGRRIGPDHEKNGREKSERHVVHGKILISQWELQ